MVKDTALLRLNSKKVISLRNFWIFLKELLYLRTFSSTKEAYLEPIQYLRWSFFVKIVKPLTVFAKKVSTNIFGWVLNMPLH